ncbi:MAG: ABC transporter permease [Clostridiales bacterium]|nr:ABC transporter permease [Clostridiales bacterium]
MKSAQMKNILRKNTITFILLIMVVLLAVFARGFLSVNNLLSILRSMAIIGVAAFGMTMVIIGGEIDLSIGSTIGLSAVLTAWVAKQLQGALGADWAVIIGMAVAILAAALVGLFNGFIRVRFNIPSFIITLAMLNVLYGLAAILSSGFPITISAQWFNVIGAGRIIKTGGFSGLPVASIWLVLIFLIVFVVMNRTRFGREVYAVGGNQEASRLSGVNIAKVKIITMVVSQVTAAISGIILASQVLSGSPQFGRGYETDVISAVIIGGASLSGGLGRTTGTLFGILFLGVILNGMTLLGVDDYVKYVVRGSLILLAVILNTIQTQKARHTL